ncbi:MAG: hypothetical protein OXI05_06470 [Bacteroidota bacterium]|nr:hypothetical protein [Bacteroidota bacterium]
MNWKIGFFIVGACSLFVVVGLLLAWSNADGELMVTRYDCSLTQIELVEVATRGAAEGWPANNIAVDQILHHNAWKDSLNRVTRYRW